MQMIAGGKDYPIYFTNLIYDEKLYTVTYKWPHTVPPLPDDCVCLGGLPLDELNRCLANARYVGAAILTGNQPRQVNHFRVSVAFGDPEPTPHPFRVPIMQGDFYVDREDSSKFWQVLHFGWQNALDPAFDEWAIMETLKSIPGEVVLPVECKDKCQGDHPAFPPGFFCK